MISREGIKSSTSNRSSLLPTNQNSVHRATIDLTFSPFPFPSLSPLLAFAINFLPSPPSWPISIKKRDEKARDKVARTRPGIHNARPYTSCTISLRSRGGPDFRSRKCWRARANQRMSGSHRFPARQHDAYVMHFTADCIRGRGSRFAGRETVTRLVLSYPFGNPRALSSVASSGQTRRKTSFCPDQIRLCHSLSSTLSLFRSYNPV